MHREVGERGRRPEHPDCPGSGYCARGCHHPHLHCVVPGGGISLKTARWVHCRPNFFLPVRVLSRLFRRLFLEGLAALHAAGELQFFGDLSRLTEPSMFTEYLASTRRCEWVVFAKRPFAGPAQVLRYLARYTHRVAISNSRLVKLGAEHVSFRWKDYRDPRRYKPKVMRLSIGEFMRRFLLHVLPHGFHRIRHYGLLANSHRTEKVKLCRNLLNMPSTLTDVNDSRHSEDGPTADTPQACPCCGGRMTIVQTFDGPLSRPRPQWRDRL